MILPPGRRGDLTNQQWERLKPLLPAQKPKVGRPSNDHRTILNGILWILRTGAPWRDLPEGYGTWEMVSGRFYRWRKSGLWSRMLQRLQSTCPMPQSRIGNEGFVLGLFSQSTDINGFFTARKNL